VQASIGCKVYLLINDLTKRSYYSIQEIWLTKEMTIFYGINKRRLTFAARDWEKTSPYSTEMGFSLTL